MHKDFVKFLNKDGIGIDYSFLENYDTKSKLLTHLEKQYPFWEKKLEESMANRDRDSLVYALQNAQNIGLAAAKPHLIQRAKNALQSM